MASIPHLLAEAAVQLEELLHDLRIGAVLHDDDLAADMISVDSMLTDVQTTFATIEDGLAYGEFDAAPEYR